MFTCIICGKQQHNAWMSRKNHGVCKSCKRKGLKPIATAAEIISICGGFTKTPIHLLRKIYKSLEVSGVDRTTFVQMVYMFMGNRINNHMADKYSIPNN